MEEATAWPAPRTMEEWCRTPLSLELATGRYVLSEIPRTFWQRVFERPALYELKLVRSDAALWVVGENTPAHEEMLFSSPETAATASLLIF